MGYFFESLTQRLPEAQVQSELLRALREWAAYVKLTFTPSSGPAAPRTLNFLFARGPHGDPFPFDGRGRVLAHTFFPAPPNPEPIAGDLHFDDDEPWGIGAGTDLFSVALHEAGHALGLGHSDRPGAVMYPYYRRAGGLTAEDIAAIRELYAARVADAGEPPKPPVIPQPAPPKAPSPTPPPSGPDTVAPTLTILSPASTSVLTYSPTITLRGAASDNVGVTEVTWSDSTGASGRAQGTTYWSVADLPLREGTNTLTVRARDAAGNTGWRAVIVTRRKR